MRDAKSRGYRVDLTFIALSNPTAHVVRVADRVAAGLHDIPREEIIRRYQLSMLRAAQALEFVDHAVFLDNSSADEPFLLVAEFDEKRWTAHAYPVPEWFRVIVLATVGIRPEE